MPNKHHARMKTEGNDLIVPALSFNTQEYFLYSHLKYTKNISKLSYCFKNKNKQT